MKTLHVTSPYMHGAEVRKAQQQLSSNPFKQDYMQGGKADGVFGPATGRACRRAKYWLGYPAGKQLPIYGDTLDGALAGTVTLPDEYRQARDRRLKAAQQKPLRVKALERAAHDVGMKEDPAGSNRCPISNRWGVQGPWCAMAVSTWYLDAGSKSFRMHVDWAYVPYMLGAAVRGDGLALVSAANLKPGDIVTFDWEQNGIPDHTGLFHSWIDQGQTFRTIEGNTAVGNDSNGGQVMRRDRAIGSVARAHGRLGLIHVGH